MAKRKKVAMVAMVARTPVKMKMKKKLMRTQRRMKIELSPYSDSFSTFLTYQEVFSIDHGHSFISSKLIQGWIIAN